jgi:hypothetical protein
LRSEATTFSLDAYLYRKNSARDLVLIRWLGNRAAADRPAVTQLNREQAFEALQIFSDAWDETHDFPELRKEMAERAADIVRSQAWQPRHAWVLAALNRRFAGDFPAQALVVQVALEGIPGRERLQRALILGALHLSAWIALLFAYPRSPWVQSFFFWNKWGRRFLGFGYVGLLITVVPWLRRRMFIPFRSSLLQPGVLEQLNDRAYFPDSEVVAQTHQGTESKRLPLNAVLAGIRGQIVLKGESGLGKTLLLLRLALAAKEPVVFLSATECSAGVVAAIQRRLQGKLRDEDYLRALIHAGGLKVLIDGLNEASPDARSRITQFVEENFKGDCALTTQPLSAMNWAPPRTASIYVLQPLRPEQIKSFLLQQWESAKDRATLDQEQYQRAVSGYVEEILTDSQGSAAAGPRLIALSNPMDATLAAELLARGERPHTFRLVEQRYEVTARRFKAEQGREFRLKPFSERVYEWRRSGEPDIKTDDFAPEVAALAGDRLMIQRAEVFKKAKGQEEINRWFFRHDKIMEFFLLPAFMDRGQGARRREHATEERFWGVYELLASRLPDSEEADLNQFLIDQAADTNRNELLNRYTIARRLRRSTRQGEPFAAAEPPATSKRPEEGGGSRLGEPRPARELAPAEESQSEHVDEEPEGAMVDAIAAVLGANSDDGRRDSEQGGRDLGE